MIHLKENVNLQKCSARVLFVDDDVALLKALERYYRFCHEDWEMYFVHSVSDALKILDEQAIDILISDLNIGENPANHFLKTVKENHPETMRFCFSGTHVQNDNISLVDHIHQFVIKPTSPEALEKILLRSLALRNVIHNDDIKRLVTATETLPTLPHVYKKLQNELNSQQASLDRVGKIISDDPVIATSVLKVVNSAFFSSGSPVTSLKEATLILGVETLKALILHAHLFSHSKHSHTIPQAKLERLGKESLIIGKLAEEITKKQGGHIKEKQNAFLSGMIHQIGKLVFFQFPDQAQKVDDLVQQNAFLEHEAEIEVFFNSSSEVGAYLLGLWGIPIPITQAVAFYPFPQKSNSDCNQFKTLTSLHLAHAFFYGNQYGQSFQENRYLDYGYLKEFNLFEELSFWQQELNLSD